MPTKNMHTLIFLSDKFTARWRVVNLISVAILGSILITGFTACNNIGKIESSTEKTKPPFEAGTAIVDITPPVGFTKYGYANYLSGKEGITSTGLKSPFYAKAIVFKQGDTKFI
jgi:hypothetical protein